MKFTVQSDVLAEAVAWAARALPARPVVPVLAGLLVQASQDELTLSCYDYEVSARVTIAAEVTEPGSALVPGRLLAEITRSLPALPVTFDDDPDGLSLDCGEAAFTIATLPDMDYPSLPELPRLAGTAEAGVLATAIAQVTPAASKDDTLPLLTCVNVELSGQVMTLAATDRYRLASRELPWSPAGDGGQPRTLLVPARTLAEAGRMMSGAGQVRILLGDGAGDGAVAGFEAGGRRLTTRLLDGEFPQFRSRFSAELGSVADLPAEGLADAVRRVALVAERGTPVQLSFGAGRVTVAAATAGHARARESVAAQFTGEEPAIAFSPQFLLDGVTAASLGIAACSQATGREVAGADGSEAAAVGQLWTARVRISFSGPGKPAVITPVPAATASMPGENDGFRYFVVPQRVLG